MPAEIPAPILAEAAVCRSCGRIRTAHYFEGKSVSYIVAWCEVCRSEDAWRFDRKSWRRFSTNTAFRYASALVGKREKLC